MKINGKKYNLKNGDTIYIKPLIKYNFYKCYDYLKAGGLITKIVNIYNRKLMSIDNKIKNLNHVY